MSPSEFIAALDRASTRCTTPLVTPLVTALGDGHIVWRCWGQGKPLVLLHGGTGSWMHWIRNVEALSHDMMVVVPDLPGSGESASPQPPFSAESIAAMALREDRVVPSDVREEALEQAPDRDADYFRVPRVV